MVAVDVVVFLSSFLSRLQRVLLHTEAIIKRRHKSHSRSHIGMEWMQATGAIVFMLHDCRCNTTETTIHTKQNKIQKNTKSLNWAATITNARHTMCAVMFINKKDTENDAKIIYKWVGERGKQMQIQWVNCLFWKSWESWVKWAP